MRLIYNRKTGVWQAWANTNGMTTSLRGHMSGVHGQLWIDEVVRLDLKRSNPKGSKNDSHTVKIENIIVDEEPWSQAGFRQQLATWQVGTDKVFRSTATAKSIHS